MSLINNLRVEMAFGSGPLDDVTTLTWTDITSSVMLNGGITFTNGKTFADRVARPGTLSLTLDNSALGGTAGRWTIGGPNQLSGWDLRVPIRVRYNSGPINLWTGYVDSASSRWLGGTRPVVQINASDRLARLQRQLMLDALSAEIRADSPTAFWPLDEAPGTNAAYNRTDNDMGVFTRHNFSYFGDGDGAIISGAQPPEPIGADLVNTFYSATTALGNGQYLSTQQMPDWSTSNPDDETFELLYYPTTLMNNGNGLFAVAGSYTQTTKACFLTAFVDGNGALNVTGFVNPGIIPGSSVVFTYTSASSVVAAGAWHHIVITQQTAGFGVAAVIEGWVNGVKVLTGSYLPASTIITVTQGIRYAARMHLGAYANNVANADGNSFTYMNTPGPGYYSSFAFYNSALSDARIAAHAGIVNGFTGETSHARFERICQYAALPANNYTTSGLPLTTMSPQPLTDSAAAGRSLMDAITEVTNTEFGDVYVNGSGQIVHASRSLRMNPSTDWSIAATAINSDNGFDYDETLIVNSATVSSGSGIVAESSDSTSISNYGNQNVSVQSFADTQNQIKSTAYGLAHRASSPAPRLRDVTVDFVTLPSSLSGQISTMISSAVADVFTVTGIPSPTGTSATLTMFIEGWTDSITESSWKRTFTTTAVTSANTPILVLNDTTYGVLNNSPKLTF